MSTAADLLNSIRMSDTGPTLAELLIQHPHIARRTAQRLISQMIARGRITAVGKGRARRYLGAGMHVDTSIQNTGKDTFPGVIPLAADSLDVLAYGDQPMAARKPVGFQREFLDAYGPNETCYLSESLRRQLGKMGRTADVGAPTGTYSRAILNRLPIDLSWASSHLEGNT